MNEGVVIILMLLAVFLLVARFSEQQAMFRMRLLQLEANAKIDALIRNEGIAFEPGMVIDEAIKRGEKIMAIRLYREATGVGLKDAKEHIEHLMQRTRS